MGLMDRLFAPITAPYVSPRPTDVTGLPWQQPQNPLTRIVIDDVFGDMVDLVDRGNAMRVPAVSRARALLVGAISDLPLVAYNNQDRLDVQPTWLYRTDDVSPWHRMAYTVDDILFSGCSLWARENGADGYPVKAWRVPMGHWSVDGHGHILVNDATGTPQPVTSKDVIYIPGPAEGLLSSGEDTIRGARQIDRAWVARTRSPIPPTLFQQTEDVQLVETEVNDLLTGWSNARTNPDTAGTGFVPYGITPVFPPTNDDSAMFIQGRNAVRLDIANLTNIPASLLDGSTATASLTYVTNEGQQSSFHEQSLRYWTAPIEHRLSMDDVVPRGQRVRFDITYNTQVAPTGEPGED